MATVAFLGTGLLGSAMVEGMLRRGDAVTVWNRTEAKARALEAAGAQVAATPGDAVAGAERVHMTLPDDAVVDEMLAAHRSPRLRPERDRHRSLDDVAARDARRGSRAARTRASVPARAGVHVAADGARRGRADARLGPAAGVRRGSRRAREDDRRGLVSRRAGRSRRGLQALRQLDALRDHGRRRRRVRDGQGPRHPAGGRARGVLEVPGRRRHQSRAARRWRAATSARASS